jgi:hypothetical protein
MHHFEAEARDSMFQKIVQVQNWTNTTTPKHDNFRGATQEGHNSTQQAIKQSTSDTIISCIN